MLNPKKIYDYLCKDTGIRVLIYLEPPLHKKKIKKPLLYINMDVQIASKAKSILLKSCKRMDKKLKL